MLLEIQHCAGILAAALSPVKRLVSTDLRSAEKARVSTISERPTAVLARGALSLGLRAQALSRTGRGAVAAAVVRPAQVGAGTVVASAGWSGRRVDISTVCY